MSRYARSGHFRVGDNPPRALPTEGKRYAVTPDLAARGQALEPLERPPSGPTIDSHQGPTEVLGP